MPALGLLEVVKVTGCACADRDCYVNFRIERVFYERKAEKERSWQCNFNLSGTKSLPIGFEDG